MKNNFLIKAIKSPFQGAGPQQAAIINNSNPDGTREICPGLYELMEFKVKAAEEEKNIEQESSEDSDYDYGDECQEFFYRRQRKNEFFESLDFKRDPKHCLVFLNEELMKKQRGVLSHFIKQVGQNWLLSRPLTQISLPIKIFDAKSFLEKCAMFFKTAPLYCELAASIPQKSFDQVLQRFKLVVAFAVSTRQFTVQMRKPFNPILGETYEARIGQYKIALEQISHHPPVTCYQMWSKHHKSFQIHGYLEYRPLIGVNTAGGNGYGPLCVEFEGGHQIEIWSPITQVSGMLYGVRGFNIHDSMIIKDPKNSLYCEIVFNPEKKSGIKSIISYGASFLSSATETEEKRTDYVEGVISR